MAIRRFSILALLSSILAWLPARADDGTEFFEKHIRPVLVDNCYKCHSAEFGNKKGGLLLDSKDGIDAGGENGAVIVRGDPEKSRLIQAIRWTDDDLQMPPKRKLKDQQIEDLVTWVKMGAPDPRVKNQVANASGVKVSDSQPFDLVEAKKWWAFQPVKSVTPPAVKNAAWVKSPVDTFILQKLEEKGLPPAKPADKRTLIRRATFDLTGLPPTEAEVEAFLADTSPSAFETVVDRLLASPHYGEKWGRHWLDLVRYTDLIDARGMGKDLPDSWRYRDWVIKSFNTDLPYDQFVKLQIAGDLLPGPSEPDRQFDGIIATGMYAIGNWGNGDADKEKVVTDIVDDQIDVTGRAFLGLTLACARCHDHKFDPISSADYYALAGIFFSSHILPDAGTPVADNAMLLRIPMATADEVAKRKAYDDKITSLTKQVDSIVNDYRKRAAAESLKHLDGYLQTAFECRGKNAVAITRYALTHDLDPAMARTWTEFLSPYVAPPPSLRKPLKRTMANVQKKEGVDGIYPSDSRQVPDALINHTDQPQMMGSVNLPPKSVSIHPGADSDVAVGWKSPVTGTVRIHVKLTDADPGGGDGIAYRLEACTDTHTRILAQGDVDNGGNALLEGAKLDAIPISEGETLQIVVDPKADYMYDTTAVEFTIAEVGGSGESWDLAHDWLGNQRDAWQIYEVLGRRSAAIPDGSALAKWLAKATAAGASTTALQPASKSTRETLVSLDAQVKAARADGKDPFSGDGAIAGPDAQLYQLLTTPTGGFWPMPRQDGSDLTPAMRERRSSMRTELAELQKKPPAMLPSAHGMQDGGTAGSSFATIGDTRIEARGKYDKLGDLVPRRLPVVLCGEHQTPIGQLTKGSGRLQLADWVANKDNPLTARVMANRLWEWHFGHGLVRTASNFGKLGTPPTHPELLDYLAQRFVDSGWSVKAMHRMIMLSSAYQQSSVPDPATFKADPANLLVGHMNRRRLEAEELRDALVVTTDNLIDTMGGPPSDMLNMPKRTIYLTTVRSDRSSFRMLFDAADPASIIDQRNESVVAPQALFLLNHPFVLGKADGLAKVVNYELHLDDRGKIDWLYRRLYARPPEPKEIEIGLKAVEALGWQGYCQTLLCTNEFVYVD